MSTPPIMPDSAGENLFPQDPMGLQTPEAYPEQVSIDGKGRSISHTHMGMDSLTEQVGGELFLGDLLPGSPLLQVPRDFEQSTLEDGSEFEGVRTNLQFLGLDVTGANTPVDQSLEASDGLKPGSGETLAQFNAELQQSASKIYTNLVNEFPPAVQNAVAATEEADAVYEQTGVRPSNETMRPSELGKEEIPIEEARFLMSWGKLIAKVLALVSKMKGMIALSEQELIAEEAKREVENYKEEMEVIKAEIKERVKQRKKIKELERKFGMNVDAMLALGIFLTLIPGLQLFAPLLLANVSLMKAKGPGNDLGSQLGKMFGGGKEENAWIGQLVGALLAMIMPQGLVMGALLMVNAIKDKEYFDQKANKPRDITREGNARIHQHNIRIAQIIRALILAMEQEDEKAELMALLSSILNMLVQILDILKSEKGGKGAPALLSASKDQGAPISNLVGLSGSTQASSSMNFESAIDTSSAKPTENSLQINQESFQKGEALVEKSTAISLLPYQTILEVLSERISTLEKAVHTLESNPEMPEEEQLAARKAMMYALTEYVSVLQGATQKYVTLSSEERQESKELASTTLNGLVDLFYRIVPEYPQDREQFLEQLKEVDDEATQNDTETLVQGLNAYLGNPDEAGNVYGVEDSEVVNR